MGKAKYPSEHDKTQYMAMKWLESLEYKCNLEVHIKSYRVDVYGEKDGDKIIIECGYTPPRRLRQLEKLATKLYVWPIGNNEPIIWNNNINICRSCGRIRPPLSFNEFNLEEFIKHKIPSNAEFAGGYLSYNEIPTRTIIKKLRTDEIIKMRQEGLTYEEIGNTLNISKERVRQLLPASMRSKRVNNQAERNRLRELGEQLENNQAIKITKRSLAQVQKIKRIWHFCFGDKARTRQEKECPTLDPNTKQFKGNNTYTIYLWLKEEKSNAKQPD